MTGALVGLSVDRKLLLLIVGLLLATITAFSATAYWRIAGVAEVAASERLQDAARPIRAMLEESVVRHRAELQRVVANVAVRDLLVAGRGRDSVEAVIHTFLNAEGGLPARIALHDMTGAVVLELGWGSLPRTDDWVARTIQGGGVRVGEVMVSPIWNADSVSFFETLTAVPAIPAVPRRESTVGGPAGSAGETARLGYISEVRRVTGVGVAAVLALIGPRATLLVGSPSEGGWTDLVGPVAPPPAGTRIGHTLVFDSPRWGEGIGAATDVRGTPWLLWVHQPRRVILASTRVLLRDMEALAVLFILVGGMSAVALGRRITRPIASLTAAAEQLASQHATARAENDTALDDIERLSEAFTRMSRRVQESHDALAASEARFRGLIENATDPIAILDADGVVRYASPAHSLVLRRSPGDLVGRGIEDLAHVDDRGQLRVALDAARERPETPVLVRARFQHADGSWRMLAGSASNLLSERSIAGIVVNWRDVTEQLSLESQLRHAHKMEAVGRLAGGIAHDLNNILTAITAFNQFVADILPLGSEAREDVAQIDLAAQRATALTKQLLAFSRQQVLQPRAMDLNSTVYHLEPMLRRLIRADLALVMKLAPDIGHVMADPAQIEQVLLNLVLNARDAMPNGGAIIVETADVDLEEDYVRKHPEVQPGPHVMLSVTDSGFGMDAETQARIFEPFYTTKGITSGTGLGLATVYGIVRQSGGSIWVYSAVGKGSTFKVFLPRHQGRAASSGEKDAPQLHEIGSATVLVVEDDDAVQRVARRALEGIGYTVHSANDGREALALVEELGGVLDLVITDLVMPELGGKALALHLSERWPKVRVLFMSGHAMEAMNRKSVLSPDDAFIAKPFSPRALTEKVRVLLRREDARPTSAADPRKRSAS